MERLGTLQRLTVALPHSDILLCLFSVLRGALTSWGLADPGRDCRSQGYLISGDRKQRSCEHTIPTQFATFCQVTAGPDAVSLPSVTGARPQTTRAHTGSRSPPKRPELRGLGRPGPPTRPSRRSRSRGSGPFSPPAPHPPWCLPVRPCVVSRAPSSW